LEVLNIGINKNPDFQNASRYRFHPDPFIKGMGIVLYPLHAPDNCTMPGRLPPRIAAARITQPAIPQPVHVK
jgi:hypothetical protein